MSKYITKVSKIQSITIASEYPDEYPHDDGRYYAVIEYSDDLMQRLAIVGLDNLHIFNDLLLSLNLTGGLKSEQAANGLHYLTGYYKS